MKRKKDFKEIYSEILPLAEKNNSEIGNTYLFSLISDSAAIEGSSLSSKDAFILFDKGVKPRTKPAGHVDMCKDLRKAYDYMFECIKDKSPVTPEMLKKLVMLIMEHTGIVRHAGENTYEAAKGEYRLLPYGNKIKRTIFADYTVIPQKVQAFCDELNENMKKAETLQEKYELSFKAHLDLVTIHPWGEGNGRLARLLSHYIQISYGIFPVRFFIEDRDGYMKSINESQMTGKDDEFLYFMATQLKKALS